MLNRSDWLPSYHNQLNYIATALTGAGVLYLLASNWFMFPRAIELAIPQVLLVFSCLLTVYFKPITVKGHCSAAFAALMTGLSLATYGQVYQTGADSFQLFAIWSVLLIPWLYFRLSAIWVLFYITSLLTFYLANEQWLALSKNTYFVYLSLFLLVQVQFAQLFCPSSRLILIILIGLISCISSSYYLLERSLFSQYDYTISVGWLLISFILPLLLAALFYFRRWAIGLSITVLAFATNASFWLIYEELILTFHDAANVIFAVATIIFIWCWIVSRILKFCLPDHFNWSRIPSVFGAWICSVLLTIGIYIAFDYEINLTLGIVLLLVGFTLLLFKAKTLFIKQLSFTLALCGQAIIVSYIYIEYYNDRLDLILITTQLAILICSWLVTSSQFWRSLQCLIFILCYLSRFPETFIYLLIIPFIIALVWPKIMTNNNWRRPIIFSLLAVVVSRVIYLFVTFNYYGLHNYNGFNHYIDYLIPILSVLIALISVEQHEDKPMRFLCMLSLVFCLGVFYYSLSLPLLNKGLLIITSGLIVGLISYCIMKMTKGANQ